VVVGITQLIAIPHHENVTNLRALLLLSPFNLAFCEFCDWLTFVYIAGTRSGRTNACVGNTAVSLVPVSGTGCF
jgi:hypothetical protein